MPGKIYKTHQPCEECGSRDNVCVYHNDPDDGGFNSFCFGCESNVQNLNQDGVPEATVKKKRSEPVKNDITVDQINKLPSIGLRDRGIVKALAEFYGLKVAKRGQADAITHHYYPYHKDSRIVGYQERTVEGKKFKGIGHAKNDIELQGQNLWPNGGGNSERSTLVITEGFLDAMAASQMLFGKLSSDRRYPVVSLPNGANSLKAVVNNMSWINTFNKVIIMLDQDDVGQKATRALVDKLLPGRAHIAKFSEKDACEMLSKGKLEEFKSAYWNAPTFSPADIVTAADARSILSKDNEVPSIPFPDFAAELNIKEYGKRMGEITVFTSGTGMGKSQFLKEDLFNMMMNHKDTKVGVVSLEESTRETLKGLQSLYLNKQIKFPEVRALVPDDVYEESMEWLVTECGDRLVMLDHQGASVSKELMEKIQYLVNIGCDYIYVDHITIAVSGETDQNRAIDTFMENLLKMAKRHEVWFGVVSHLRKTSGDKKSFESGGIPTDDDLKGSGSIKQIAFTIIALVRDKMSKTKANETKIYVLKSRYTGSTGYAGSYTFDTRTGRLLPIDDMDDDDDEVLEVRSSEDTFEVANEKDD